MYRQEYDDGKKFTTLISGHIFSYIMYRILSLLSMHNLAMPLHISRALYRRSVNMMRSMKGSEGV